MRREPKRIKILLGLEAAGGGALKHLCALIAHFRQEFDMTVMVSPRDPEAPAAFSAMQAAGIRVLQVQMSRQPDIRRDLKAFCQIFAHLLRNRYDVIHAHSSKAGVLFRCAAWLRRVPLIIYTPHCFSFQDSSSVKQRRYAAIERILAGITDYIIVSPGEKKHALDHRIAAAEKLVHINNAVAENDYLMPERQLARQQLGIPADSLVIGAVGRLSAQKDWPTCMRVARQVLTEHANAVFIIAGDGQLLHALQQEVHDHGLSGRVLLLGYQTDVSLVYAAMDIFVSTSLWEGLPYALLEALLYKKPVVVTDLHYDGVVINGENGFVVPAGDHKAFADKIGILLKNESLRRAFGLQGQHLLRKNCSFDTFLEQHRHLYNTALRCHKNILPAERT